MARGVEALWKSHVSLQEGENSEMNGLSHLFQNFLFACGNAMSATKKAMFARVLTSEAAARMRACNSSLFCPSHDSEKRKMG
jgi:hypothetical protein